MNNEQLLLTDLLGRLPYDVRCRLSYSFGEEDEWEDATLTTIEKFVDGEEINYIAYFRNPITGTQLKLVKPYLRPISSLTEEEMDKIFDILQIDENTGDWIKINDALGIKFILPNGRWIEDLAEVYDYLNSIHIDYRGLIEKGLALPLKNI